MGRMEGRVAVITGGASGIGAATVRKFVSEGAKVVIADMQDEMGQAVAEEMGGGFDLYIKFEGLNPTGSFKDRGMTAAIGEAAGRQVKAVICASTGNTAASAAAYAARAGLRAIVLIPEGKVAMGKLAGAIADALNDAS